MTLAYIAAASKTYGSAVVSELATRGHCFELDTGEHWTGIECSDFNLLARYQAGEDITPVLAQRRDIGYNLLRVWTLFDIPWIGTITTCDYNRIPSFVALCASYGLYVEFTAYTGINDPAHWPQLCDVALQCSPRPLLELANEWDIHENDVDSQGRRQNIHQYQKAPAPLLSSSGSMSSQAQPTERIWDYIAFHTNGAFEEQRKIGHNAMEIWGGPTLTNETSRCPEVGMWGGADAGRVAQLAFDSAAGAALLCAGACFHSVQGKISQLWDGLELVAAINWVEGARSVDLACQDGPYTHRTDLETPDVLRAYERPVAGHNGVVLIGR